MKALKTIIPVAIIIYACFIIFTTIFPGTLAPFMPYIAILSFTPLILPMLLTAFYFVNYRNKVIFICCFVSIIFVLISAIISMKSALAFLSGDLNIMQLLSFTASSKSSSILMDLSSSLQSFALSCYLYKQNNCRLLKALFKISCGFTILFTVCAFMSFENIYGIVFRILSMLAFLWYVYLIILSALALFRKDNVSNEQTIHDM